MAIFFASQLDFIFFAYGLAFLLLGGICFAISRLRGPGNPWTALGFFGFLHGIGEWLDLSALMIGDTESFAALRVFLMTASYVLLMEFARLKAIEFGLVPPGRWIYLPLLTIVALSGVGRDMSIVAAMARYIFGFGGSLAVSLVFFQHARQFSGNARFLAWLTAFGFVLYGIAAGAIVPAAPIWPATILNQSWFLAVTDVPIQLVRGMLAIMLGLSVWAIWGCLIAVEVSSDIYTAYVQRQFRRTTVAFAVILALGWVLTDFFSQTYRTQVENHAIGDTELLVGRLAQESAIVDGSVDTLAGSPAILPLLTGGNVADDRRARSVLDLHVSASGSNAGVVIDTSANVIASSGDDQMAILQNGSRAPWVDRLLRGGSVHEFDVDATTGRPSFLAGKPVRNDAGDVVGAAILQKSLGEFELELRHFSRAYYLINQDGRVMLSNRQATMFTPLWPLAADRMRALAPQTGSSTQMPVLDQEIVGARWTKVGGKREYVIRQFVDHSRWSLVIVMQAEKYMTSRILGIIVTLLVTVIALTWLVGHGFGMRENIQRERRQELQELAQLLRHKASTDALTGLFNRMRFNEGLASEMARSQRYNTPLSLMIYDVDHFKEVNDVFGHQTGDSVLVRLSEIVKNLIRPTDLLARWGGEEFVILLPATDGSSAHEAAARLVSAIKVSDFDIVGTITCSFGVTEYCPGESAEILIARADNALYRAKMNGRNRFEIARRPDVATSSLALTG